jgi:hypothetical protein
MIRLVRELSNDTFDPDTSPELTAWGAFIVWFAAWCTNELPRVNDETAIHSLLRQLMHSELPDRLDSVWRSWDNESVAVEGFDVVFCDAVVATWPGSEQKGFYQLATGMWLAGLPFPPLEKRAIDAVVLFVRNMNRVVRMREQENKKEADHADTRRDEEAGAEEPNQGSP